MTSHKEGKAFCDNRAKGLEYKCGKGGGRVADVNVFFNNATPSQI